MAPSIRPGLGVDQVVGGRREALFRLLRTYGARDIRVFGSVARGTATRHSDLDLLVRFHRPIGLLRRIELTERVQALVGREVDLATEDSLFWLSKPQILAEAVPL